MSFIDLTHPLLENMPVFPGKIQPVFTEIATIEKDGYREKNLHFDSHIGTHIDAPAHMVKNGKTLDQFPVSAFSGNAFIIEISKGILTIDLDFLLRFWKEIETADFILLKTGWHRFWGSQQYFDHYPVMHTEAAQWLSERPLKGIGIDAVSVDPIDSEIWTNHLKLFSGDLLIVENLMFPDFMANSRGDFFCFPLKINNADGSPVRAVFRY